MIPFFDRFIDTKEKRYHLLLLLLLLVSIVLIIPYIILGYKLFQLNSYEALFAFLKKPYVEWTYLSRILVDGISIVKLSFANVLACLMENIKAFDILLMVLLILSYGILETSRKTTVVLLLLVVEVFLSGILAMLSLQAGTLHAVINNIRWIGVIMLVINCILLLLLIYTIVKQIRAYSQALLYEVEEEKEHIDLQQ